MLLLVNPCRSVSVVTVVLLSLYADLSVFSVGLPKVLGVQPTPVSEETVFNNSCGSPLLHAATHPPPPLALFLIFVFSCFGFVALCLVFDTSLMGQEIKIQL